MRLLALAVNVLVKGLKQTPLCTKKEKVHDGTPRDNGGQWLSMRNVLLIAATVAVMVVSFAAPAMADEVQDEESLKEEEKPLKDPGIRLCDITPTECDNTDDSKDDNKNNEHNNDQDKYQEYCNNPMLVYDPAYDKNNEHNNDQDKYQEYCNNPMLVYDPACDKNNEHSQDSDDSQDEQGHNSGADPDSKDPNSPVEEEKPLKDPGIRLCDITPTECENTEEDSAQKTPVVGDPRNDSSNSDEAGQIANSSGQLATSPTTYGCPFDYEYYELWDTCRPGPKDFPLIFTAAGEMPAPDSLGGYVSLAYGLPSEAATALGFGVQVLLGHYVGDGLVGWGEDVVGPVGYGLQGVGYTVGFASDAVGLALEGAGEIVGAAADGVGEVVDAVADNVVYPILGGVVEAVNNSVEKVADAVGSTAKKVFCKIFC